MEQGTVAAKAGVLLPQRVDVAAPFGITPVRGGRYAVLRHKGPYSDMHAAYEWLFGEWRVKSGHEVADAPIFEEYLN